MQGGGGREMPWNPLQRRVSKGMADRGCGASDTVSMLNGVSRKTPQMMGGSFDRFKQDNPNDLTWAWK